MTVVGESGEGRAVPRSNAASAVRAAALGAGFGLLAVTVAVFVPFAVMILGLSLFLSEDQGETVGWVLLVLVLAALAAAAVWGFARGLRAVARAAPSALPGAGRTTVLTGSVLAVAMAVMAPVNPLEDPLPLVVSALAAAAATAVLAVVTVGGGSRVRGTRTLVWITVALFVVTIGGRLVAVPLLSGSAAQAEVRADIDAYGGQLAVVDGGGWRVTWMSWDPNEEYLDLGYENADGDRATLRHIPAADWGDQGTAEGYFMCPLRGFTCEETDGGSRLLVKENGRLYSTELTLGDGSGVDAEVRGDDSKPDGEEVSPQLVEELSKYTRQATREERERVIEAVAEERG